MIVFQPVAEGVLLTGEPGRIVSKTVYVSASRAAEETPAFIERCVTPQSEEDYFVLRKVDNLVLLELGVDVEQ